MMQPRLTEPGVYHGKPCRVSRTRRLSSMGSRRTQFVSSAWPPSRGNCRNGSAALVAVRHRAMLQFQWRDISNGLQNHAAGLQ